MRSASSRAIARPEARARRRVAGVEALEDVIQLPATDARPVVGHAQLGGPGAVVVGRAAPRRDRDPRSLGRVDERVVDQHPHDLGHALGVAVRLDVEMGRAVGHVDVRRPCARPRRRTRPRPGSPACAAARARARGRSSRRRAARGRAGRSSASGGGPPARASSRGTRRGSPRRGPRPEAARQIRPARRSGCAARAMRWR